MSKINDTFNFLNPSPYAKKGNSLEIYAPKNTDFFNCPIEGSSVCTAPFLYQEMTGDFVLRAKVRHNFCSKYDAGCLMALDNENLWAKACFELSDLNKPTIVTVMTNNESDDANGVTVEKKEVWLQLARKDDVFAVHYSCDGKEFRMVRLTHLSMNSTIKVGFEAQAPTGDGGLRYFSQIKLDKVTLLNIRNGNF